MLGWRESEEMSMYELSVNGILPEGMNENDGIAVQTLTNHNTAGRHEKQWGRE